MGAKRGMVNLCCKFSLLKDYSGGLYEGGNGKICLVTGPLGRFCRHIAWGSEAIGHWSFVHCCSFLLFNKLRILWYTYPIPVPGRPGKRSMITLSISEHLQRKWGCHKKCSARRKGSHRRKGDCKAITRFLGELWLSEI